MSGFEIVEIVGLLGFLIFAFVALRVIRKSRAKAPHDRRQVNPILLLLIPALPALGVYSAVPYWATLALMRPWSKYAHVRAFARKALNSFYWLNTLWLIAPLLVGIYIIYGNVSWGIAVVLYIVTALLLHSIIAHSADGCLKRWEAGLETNRERT